MLPGNTQVQLNRAEEAEETVERNSRFLAFLYGIGAMMLFVVLVSRMWRDTEFGESSNDRTHDVYSMAGPLFSLFAVAGGIHASNLHSQSYALALFETAALLGALLSAVGVLIYQIVHEFTADSLLVTLSWIWAAGVALLCAAALVASTWNAVARRARNKALKLANRATLSKVYLNPVLVYMSLLFPIGGVGLLVAYWIAIPVTHGGAFSYSLFSIGIPGLSFGLAIKTFVSFSKDARGVVYGIIIRFVSFFGPIYALIRDTDVHWTVTGVWVLDLFALGLVAFEAVVWVGCVVTSDSYSPKERYGGCCAPTPFGTDSLDAVPLLNLGTSEE